MSNKIENSESLGVLLLNAGTEIKSLREQLSESKRYGAMMANEIVTCQGLLAKERELRKELVELVESERAFYISDDECGLQEDEYNHWKDVLKRAKDAWVI